MGSERARDHSIYKTSLILTLLESSHYSLAKHKRLHVHAFAGTVQVLLDFKEFSYCLWHVLQRLDVTKFIAALCCIRLLYAIRFFSANCSSISDLYSLETMYSICSNVNLWIVLESAVYMSTLDRSTGNRYFPLCLKFFI